MAFMCRIWRAATLNVRNEFLEIFQIEIKSTQNILNFLNAMMEMSLRLRLIPGRDSRRRTIAVFPFDDVKIKAV